MKQTCRLCGIQVRSIRKLIKHAKDEHWNDYLKYKEQQPQEKIDEAERMYNKGKFK